MQLFPNFQNLSLSKLSTLIDGMSTCKAAKQYGIPRTTLNDRKNHVYETSKIGRKNDLTDEEEQALKGYINYMASINHPLSVPAVKAFAWSIAKRSTTPIRFNQETGPGKKWYRNFKARHNLTNRKPDNVDRGRSRMGNTTVWKQHFDFLEETIDQLQLRDKPQAIFNCDESMIAMERRSGRVVVSRKTKHTYSESKGSRDHITVNACVSASGYIMPPHIIFSQSYPSGPYARDGPMGALYSISDNGYMDTELFHGFISKLFIPYTNQIAGPKLLILDGHGSHLNIDVINLCRESNIHLYCLPPHTTHIFQPLDVVIFRPVKAHFNKITQNLKLATLGSSNPINCCKTNFTRIFREPWESITVALIRKGFEKCGISPLNRDAIDKSRLSGESANTNIPQQQSATMSSPNQQPTTSSNQQLPAPEEDQSSPMATHSNPLVATGIIPANLYNSFIFPEINQSKQKQPRVVTKSRLLTSDEHIEMYNEKMNKKRQEEEAKQKRKNEHEQRKAEKEKEQQKKQSGVRTRGGLRKRGGGIRTRGGKRNWVYIPPEESSTEEEEVEEDEEEDWECKACGEDDGFANDFLGCDTCDRWFHIRCVKKSADDFFQCQYCQ